MTEKKFLGENKFLLSMVDLNLIACQKCGNDLRSKLKREFPDIDLEKIEDGGIMTYCDKCGAHFSWERKNFS